MGAIANVMEDFEKRLVSELNEAGLNSLWAEQERINNLKESIEYRKADVIYLTKKGFELDKLTDSFVKKEDITHGEFPGKYKISIWFPDDYPKSPPIIRFKPLTPDRGYSTHIQANGKICVAKHSGAHNNTYWKSNMNARGALILAYHLATGELDKDVYETKKKKKNIKGTIYEKLKEVVDRELFIKEFASKHFEDIDVTYEWEELAYLTSKSNVKIKAGLVNYCNEKERKEKMKNDRKGKDKGRRSSGKEIKSTSKNQAKV